MNRTLPPAAAAMGLAAVLSLAACGATGRVLAPTPASQGDTIRPFTGEAEIREWLQARNAESQREYNRVRRNDPPPRMIIEPPTPPPPAPRPAGVPEQGRPPRNEPGSLESRPQAGGAPAPPAPSPRSPAPAGTVPAQSGAPRTANEPAGGVRGEGMEEGGIVKVAGDYLLVLHRGRLFTVRIGGDALQPVSAVDAFGPGVDPWQIQVDEMLVSGDQVVVVGTRRSPDRVQLGFFRLEPGGQLAHRATYALRGRDELWQINHRSRGDAVRLVGDRLVHYAPLDLEHPDPLSGLPVVEGPGGTFRPAGMRVYRPAGRVSSQNLQLHSLTSCALGGAELRCESTVLLAPDGPFHMSPSAVYVWSSQPDGWEEDAPARTVLYRMPLDGSTPTALRVSGDVVDPAAFAESADGHVNVLTRMNASGERMFGAEYDRYGLALLRVPVSALGAGRGAATRARYRLLPKPSLAQLYARIVGDRLVYGNGNGRNGALGPGASAAHVVRLAGGGVGVVPLPHPVDRVEALGSGLVVLGADRQHVHLSTLRLEADTAVLAEHRAIPYPGFAPGFFHRPDGEDAALVGVPLLGPTRPGFEWMQLGSARVLFMRADGLRLQEAGELASGDPTPDDGCVAGCVTWYGNARPLFVRGRVFALLGYELVEGREEGGRVRELRRVGFAPLPPTATVAGTWTFTETLSYGRGDYDCANAGTMWLERAGAGLAVRYRQMGACTIDGVAARSDGEGSGTGTLTPTSVTLRIGPCEYRALMHGVDGMAAYVTCRIPGPDGTPREVGGRWQARRAAP